MTLLYDITVDSTKVSENLTDFPLQVKLNSTDHSEFFNELVVGGGSVGLFKWNPSDFATGFTISTDGLTATKTATSWYSGRADTSWTSGKKFWVVEFTDDAAADNRMAVGVGTAAHSLTVNLGYNQPGWGYYGLGEWYGNSNGSTSSGKQVLTTGDSIAIAVDIDAGKIWFGYILSGQTDITWYGDPVAGTGEAYNTLPTDGTAIYPMISLYATGADLTVNPGPDFGTFTVPTGYTYYTEEPILKPLKVKFEQNLSTEGPDLFVYDDGGVNYSVSPDGQTVTKTSSTSWTSIRATTGWNSGKHFWVTKIVSGSSNGIMVGVGTADHTLDHYISAAGADQGWAYYAYGDYRTPTGTVGTVMGVGTGHYIAIALDMDAGKIWFGYALSAETDIVWYGDPSAGTGDVLTGIPTDGTALYPMLTIYYNGEILETDSKNFGTFTVPTGFEPAGGPLEMTQLPAEVAYSSTTEAIYHTKVPTVSASADTEITLSFDNTWDDNVYELGDLCIQSDTTNGSTTFSDSSIEGHTIESFGNVQHSTAAFKIGSSSILFDGTGDYLRVAASAASLQFGVEDFTIDFWINYIDYAHAASLDYILYVNTSNYIRTTDTGALSVKIGDIALQATSGFLNSNDTWYHVAVMRKDGVLYLYVDGVSVATPIACTSDIVPLDLFNIGGNSGSNCIHAYLDQFRIAKGIAAWTEAFTPPTTAYKMGYIGETGSKIAQTVWDDGFAGVWLMRQDPTIGGPCILDSTANKNHGTPVNMGVLDPAVGGLTFDGTGYITVPDHDSLDGYTSGMSLDLFLKQSTNITQQAVFSKWVLNSGSAADDSYIFGLYQGAFEAYVDNSGTTVIVVNREGDIDDNTFRHLSYGWDVPTTTFYIDAVSYPTSSTMAFNLTAGTGPLDIGARNNNGSRDNKFTGVIGAAMLSNIARSLAWVSAMKENLHATLVTVTDGVAPPAVSYQPIIFIVS